MKHLYRHIFVAAVGVITLGGCTEADGVPTAVRNYPTFSALIDGAHSRAADDYWDGGDPIGISGGGVSNVCHVTRFGDGNFTAERPEQQFYFQNSDPVVFTAYYPYNSSRDATSGLISISTADQANQNNFDFLWAEAEGSRVAPDVEFLFTHRMSKVTFVFKNGNNMDVSAINRIRLNGLVVDGTFDTTTGVCGVDAATPTASTTMSLTDVRAEEPVTPLFLFPQEAESVKLEIYDSGSQYFACYLSIPDKELIAGYNYTYTITVNKTGLQVTGATLSDWVEEEDKSEASSADE